MGVKAREPLYTVPASMSDLILGVLVLVLGVVEECFRISPYHRLKLCVIVRSFLPRILST